MIDVQIEARGLHRIDPPRRLFVAVPSGGLARADVEAISRWVGSPKLVEILDSLASDALRLPFVKNGVASVVTLQTTPQVRHRLRSFARMVGESFGDETEVTMHMPGCSERNLVFAVIEVFRQREPRRHPHADERNFTLRIVGDKTKSLQTHDLQRVLNHQEFIRSTVIAPPNDLGPRQLANEIVSAAEQRLQTRVLTGRSLRRQGLALVHAVAQAGGPEPHVVVLKHERRIQNRDPQGRPRIAVVGKGVTFDTGGLNLKDPENMFLMKSDMAGAVTAAAATFCASEFGANAEIHTVLGLTENAVGAAAYKPGDVLRAHEKTVEVTNTDAEGRLVLADLIGWVKRTVEPDVIISVGTLTMPNVFGYYAAPYWTNDELLATKMEVASTNTADRFHRMPLDQDLRADLDSDVADIKNFSEWFGYPTHAALFLEAFAGDTSWLHCEIGGVSMRPKNRGFHFEPTGFGLQTLVNLLMSNHHARNC